MLKDARAYCVAAGIKKPTRDDIRGVILDNHGEEIAKQVCGITVADLQNAVNKTMKKTAKKTATTKAAKPAKKKALRAILGHSMIAIARAFGKHGFMPAQAVAAIQKVEPKASVNAIRTFVQAGRHGERGKPAPVTKKQLKELVAAAA